MVSKPLRGTAALCMTGPCQQQREESDAGKVLGRIRKDLKLDGGWKQQPTQRHGDQPRQRGCSNIQGAQQRIWCHKETDCL